MVLDMARPAKRAARAMRTRCAILPRSSTASGRASRISRAALLAGLAMSNTKTALAHSLSYPITLDHGVPHGLACSFSLPLVMRAAIGQDTDCDAALARIFGSDLEAGAMRLANFLVSLEVSTSPLDYGVEEAEWREIAKDAFAGARGRNYIGSQERFTALAS